MKLRKQEAPPSKQPRRPGRARVRAIVAAIAGAGGSYVRGAVRLYPEYEQLESLLDVPGEPHRELLRLRFDGIPLDGVDDCTDRLLADFDERLAS